jgi:hypothetical protein
MNRRDMLKLSSYAVAAASSVALDNAAMAQTGSAGGNVIACWDHFEINLPGPSAGNPFIDVTVGALSLSASGGYG